MPDRNASDSTSVHAFRFLFASLNEELDANPPPPPPLLLLLLILLILELILLLLLLLLSIIPGDSLSSVWPTTSNTSTCDIVSLTRLRRLGCLHYTGKFVL
jgi:hypothetical protein